ncbi:MAG: lipoyl synthase [Marinilabiliales bacterium]
MLKRTIDPNKPKVKLPTGKNYLFVKDIVNSHHLHTICQSGNCPNIAECWNNKTATFMILGDICTRNCRFCSVKTGKPLPPDKAEPERIANSVFLMNLDYCVITSVDRDDLEDGGSFIWAKTIENIHKKSPKTTIETLIPDFKFNTQHLDLVINAKPDIISHNLETVKRLSPKFRPQADYYRSLNVIKYISDNNIVAKSGIMVGIGETTDEIYETMDDLLNSGCSILTIGQYLQPTKNQLPVERFVTTEEFEKYKETGLRKGFKAVESGPLVRSSYNAHKHKKTI